MLGIAAQPTIVAQQLRQAGAVKRSETQDWIHEEIVCVGVYITPPNTLLIAREALGFDKVYPTYFYVMRLVTAQFLERNIMLLKTRKLFCALLIIQLAGCAQNAQISQIPYSEPPAPPAGMGLLYVYNIEMPNKLQMLPFVTIDQDLKEKPYGIGAASIKTGEYSWVHLAAGVHEAVFVNGQSLVGRVATRADLPPQIWEIILPFLVCA